MRRPVWSRAKAELRARQRLSQLRGLAGRPATAATDDPVTVYGLFSSSTGLGEAGRLTANGLERIGRKVFRVDATPHLRGRADPDSFDRDPGRGPVVFHLNPVEAAEVMAALRPPRLAERPRIGVWLYELDPAPARWADYAPLFHQIWSPSPASRNALASIAVSARLVPYRHAPLSVPGERSDGVFDVLVMADYNSSLARKNVGGAIQSFRAAFGHDPSARLTLKLSNLPRRHGLRAQLDTPATVLMEEALEFDRLLELIGQSDALLSLHRGEGYGLTLVEAMLMGTPVVMSREPTTRTLHVPGACVAVPSARVPVRDPQRIYRGGVWAEPDMDAAADALAALKRGTDARWLPTKKARADAARALFCSDERLEPLRAALSDLERDAGGALPAA